MVQYSTALSHIFLAGTGLYCFRSVYDQELIFTKMPFAIITTHSLLGVWRWGNPAYGYKINGLYKTLSKLQDLLILPSIVTTIWLKYNYSFSLACAHTFVSLVPLLLYLYDNRKEEPVDAFLGGNILSLLVVSYYNNNQYGISTAVSYVLSYFLIKHNVIYSLPIDVPTQDLFNYSLCFFSIFAMKAILEPL